MLQQIGSISLACGLTIRSRWIPSEYNVSNGPSRGQIAPGAYVKLGSASETPTAYENTATEESANESYSSASLKGRALPQVGAAVKKMAPSVRTQTSSLPKKKAVQQPRRTIHKMKHVDSTNAGSRSKKLPILEQKSVSCEVKNQYAGYLDRFKGFCVENGYHCPPEHTVIDPLLTDYMDVLYLDGGSCHEGEKTLAALEFEFLTLKGKMLRSRRALRGWRKEMPPDSRFPL